MARTMSAILTRIYFELKKCVIMIRDEDSTKLVKVSQDSVALS